jgi:hypothetical protein
VVVDCVEIGRDGCGCMKEGGEEKRKGEIDRYTEGRGLVKGDGDGDGE